MLTMFFSHLDKFHWGKERLPRSFSQEIKHTSVNSTAYVKKQNNHTCTPNCMEGGNSDRSMSIFSF